MSWDPPRLANGWSVETPGGLVWRTLQITDAIKLDPFTLENGTPTTDGTGVTTVPVAENGTRDQLNTCLVYEWGVGLVEPTSAGVQQIALIRFSSMTVAPQWALLGGIWASTASRGSASGIRRRTAGGQDVNCYAINHTTQVDGVAAVLFGNLTTMQVTAMISGVTDGTSQDVAIIATAACMDDSGNGDARCIESTIQTGIAADDSRLIVAIASPFIGTTATTNIVFRAEYALVDVS